MLLMRNANIGRKISAAFGVVLAVSILTTGVGLWQMNKMSASTKALLELPLKKERLVSDWYRTIYGGSRRTLAIAKSTDNSLVDFFKQDSATGSKQAGALLQQVQELLTSEGERRLVQEIAAARDYYNVQKAAVTKAKEASQSDEANRILQEKFIPASDKYQALLQQLLQVQRDEIDRNASLINDASSNSLRMQMMLTALLVLLVVAAGWMLKGSIVKPLAAAIGIARRVAKGDLTADIRVTSRDEAGQMLEALRDMNEALRKLVTEVKQSTTSISVASDEIAQGNADLSTRTEQQAGALEETASSMEELTSTVRQNADNARQANQAAVATSEIAARGGEVVGKVVDTMAAISASSRRVADIIGTIDGIAFQTNILALNAAVEAARAGEQGRGFAVVASEVRNLAQRSAAAARESKELIEASVATVNDGSRLVDEAGMTMEDIVRNVSRVTDLMAEISAATQEQTAGIEQVNSAIAQMDEATQQNAALVEQAAAASMSMREQAGTLASSVQAFQTDEGMTQTLRPQAIAPAMPARPSSRQAAIPAPVKRGTGGTLVARREPGVSRQAAGGADWEEF